MHTLCWIFYTFYLLVIRIYFESICNSGFCGSSWSCSGKLCLRVTKSFWLALTCHMLFREISITLTTSVDCSRLNFLSLFSEVRFRDKLITNYFFWTSLTTCLWTVWMSRYSIAIWINRHPHSYTFQRFGSAVSYIYVIAAPWILPALPFF